MSSHNCNLLNVRPSQLFVHSGHLYKLMKPGSDFFSIRKPTEERHWGRQTYSDPTISDSLLHIHFKLWLCFSSGQVLQLTGKGLYFPPLRATIVPVEIPAYKIKKATYGLFREGEHWVARSLPEPNSSQQPLFCLPCKDARKLKGCKRWAWQPLAPDSQQERIPGFPSKPQPAEPSGEHGTQSLASVMSVL